MRCALIGTCVMLLAWATPLLEVHAEPTSVSAELDAWIGHQMNASNIPGYAVTVVSADDSLLEQTYGTAGAGRPVGPDTPFVIGSTSKSFTALAVMQQVDAGAVDLDGPVRRYVPEFTMADPAAAGITVRQLLQQTSGIAGSAGGPILKSARDGTAEQAIAELRDSRLAGAPGESFRYANANFVLAGLVLERASGLPYGQYVQQRIFDPLGMRHSYASVQPARQDGLAEGHRFWFGFAAPSGPTVRSGLLAAGYLISSVSDLGRYLSLYLNNGETPEGVRIVSRAGLQTMLAPGPEATLGPWADGARVHYAMGWFVGGPWSEPALLHPGNAPDSSAMIVLLPQRGWAVAGATNATNEISGCAVGDRPAEPECGRHRCGRAARSRRLAPGLLRRLRPRGDGAPFRCGVGFCPGGPRPASGESGATLRPPVAGDRGSGRPRRVAGRPTRRQRLRLGRGVDLVS